jgi:hypothetical protein
MASKYIIDDPNDNESISVLLNGIEVMRIIRNSIWHLYLITNNEIGTQIIAKDQYRNDLIERIQLGYYDKKITQEN